MNNKWAQWGLRIALILGVAALLSIDTRSLTEISDPKGPPLKSQPVVIPAQAPPVFPQREPVKSKVGSNGCVDDNEKLAVLASRSGFPEISSCEIVAAEGYCKERSLREVVKKVCECSCNESGKGGKHSSGKSDKRKPVQVGKSGHSNDKPRKQPPASENVHFIQQRLPQPPPRQPTRPDLRGDRPVSPLEQQQRQQQQQQRPGPPQTQKPPQQQQDHRKYPQQGTQGPPQQGHSPQHQQQGPPQQWQPQQQGQGYPQQQGPPQKHGYPQQGPPQMPPQQRQPQQVPPEQRPPQQRPPQQGPPEQRQPQQRPPEQQPREQRPPEQRQPQQRYPQQEQPQQYQQQRPPQDDRRPEYALEQKRVPPNEVPNSEDGDGMWVPKQPPDSCCEFISQKIQIDQLLNDLYGTAHQSCCVNDEIKRYRTMEWVSKVPNRFDGEQFFQTMTEKVLVFIGDSMTRQQIAGLICLIERNHRSPSVFAACSKHSNHPLCQHPIISAIPDKTAEIFRFENNFIIIRTSWDQRLKYPTVVQRIQEMVHAVIASVSSFTDKRIALTTVPEILAFLDQLRTGANVRVAVVDSTPKHPNMGTSKTTCDPIPPDSLLSQQNRWLFDECQRRNVPLLSTQYLHSRFDAHLEHRAKWKWSDELNKLSIRTQTDCDLYCQDPNLWTPLVLQIAAATM